MTVLVTEFQNFTGPGSSSYDLNITNGTDEISILDSEFLTFAGGDNVYVESSGNTVTINTQAGGDADTNESERVDNLVYWGL